MVIQNTPSIPSRIVLQVAGFWDKYLWVHHLKDDTQGSSTSSSDALADLGISWNSSLCKGKGVLETHSEEIVPTGPFMSTLR